MNQYTPEHTWRWSLRFSALLLAFAAVLATRYFQMMSWPDSLLEATYFVLAYVGHFSLLSVGLWVLVWLPLSVLVRNGLWARLLITTLGALVLLLMLVDTFIYQQYRLHINGFMVALFVNDKNNEVFDFGWGSWAALWALAAALWAALWWLGQRLGRRDRSMRTYGWGVVGTLLCWFGSQAIHVYADAHYLQTITQHNQHFPLYQPITAQRWMAKNGWIDAEAKAKYDALKVNSASKSVVYPLKPLRYETPQPLNVLMVVIDSWRADELNENVTPYIEALARSSIRFDHHFSGSNSTRSGLFSLFYGIPGLYWDAMFANKVEPALMTAFRHHQYDIGVFASANLTNPEFDRTIFSQVRPLRLNSEGKTPAERDASLTRDWLQWIGQRPNTQQPFFGFLFYDAPHGYSIPKGHTPFMPDEDINYLALKKGFDPTGIRNRYRNAVHYNDQLIGQVIEDLRNRALLDRTVVIITGAHGQEFNDFGKNYWGHGSNYGSAQLRVPMVVHWPGRTPERVSDVTSHMGVAPTVLRDVLGVVNPLMDHSTGLDLWHTRSRSWNLAGNYKDFAIIDDQYIITAGFDGLFTAYDHQLNRIDRPDLNMAHVQAAMVDIRRFYKP
jgi:membrane-anchored protein YejM (alkaline phosphatase superfamily)